MKVLFDTQIFILQKHGGISRLFSELYREYTMQDYGIEAFMPAFYADNMHAKEYNLPQRILFTTGHFKGKTRFAKAFNNYSFRKSIKRINPDLIHPTYYEYPFNMLSSIPFVITVHDMIHEKFASTFFFHDKNISEYKKKLAISARRIIAVSKATKNDLIECFNIDPSKIDVVYHGNSMVIENFLYSKEDVLNKPYILFVGQRSLYKNFLTFIKGCAPILNKYDLDLLCVGGGNFTNIELEQCNKLGILKRVHQLTLNDKQLRVAYKNAIAFVFPSLYEGFGIPLLEAFSQGCPIIASDIPVFREIAGDAALYCDPGSYESIEHAIEQMISNEAMRQKYILKGKNKIKEYSWSRCALQTANVYKKALED